MGTALFAIISFLLLDCWNFANLIEIRRRKKNLWNWQLQWMKEIWLLKGLVGKNSIIPKNCAIDVPKLNSRKKSFENSFPDPLACYFIWGWGQITWKRCPQQHTTFWRMRPKNYVKMMLLTAGYFLWGYGRKNCVKTRHWQALLAEDSGPKSWTLQFRFFANKEQIPDLEWL